MVTLSSVEVYLVKIKKNLFVSLVSLLGFSILINFDANAFCGSIASYAKSISGGERNAPMPVQFARFIESVGGSKDDFDKLGQTQKIDILQRFFKASISSNLFQIGQSNKTEGYSHAVTSAGIAVDAFQYPATTYNVGNGGLSLKLYSTPSLNKVVKIRKYKQGDIIKFFVIASSEKRQLVKLVYGKSDQNPREFIGLIDLDI